MPWVRLEEDFANHPKIATVGVAGMALQVAALCYANRHLTDGLVPHGALRRLVDFHELAELKGDEWIRLDAWDVAERLVMAGIWDVTPRGFRIHDYTDYQPTRAEVEELRAIRAEAGRKGAQARAQQRAKQDAGKMLSKTSSKTAAKSQPVPVPETPMVKVEGTGTGGRGVRGEGAASPSSASRHGDADSAAQVPKLSAQLRAEAAARTLAAHGIDNGAPPPPATRDDVDPADYEAERRRQLAALEAMESETP